MSAQNYAGRKQRKPDQRQKENQVARIQNAPLKTLEVRDNAQSSDAVHDPGFTRQLGQELGDRRETGQNQEQTDHHGKNEADDLVARDGGGHATDRQIPARHQQAPDIAAENDAVVRTAEIVDREDQRKGQEQGQRQKQPGRQELPDNRLPRRDRHGEQQFDGAKPPFLRPQSHPHRRHQKKKQPGLPDEEARQRCLAQLEKGRSPDHEGEEPAQQQENHQKNVRDRRREIAD